MNTVPNAGIATVKAYLFFYLEKMLLQAHKIAFILRSAYKNEYNAIDYKIGVYGNKGKVEEMGFQEIFLIGVGLSMDAFAVALCKGLNMKKVNYWHTVVIAVFFGGFQAIMPLFGWFLGKQFESYIVSVDHWIAFALLLYIGGKMIAESGKNDEEETEGDKLDLKELTIMAIATSIDALAVGITLAFLRVSIFSSITIIGITTFCLSIVGVMIGNRFGMKFKSKAEIAGGVILILIGLKILLEHLGILVL